jgi:hypothetical protein
VTIYGVDEEVSNEVLKEQKNKKAK